MDEYEYSHVIQDIKNIRKDGRVNRYHEHILGKRCSIQCDLVPGCMGAFVVESFWWYDYQKWFYTTIIQSVDTRPDGAIVMQTQNTIYTFAPISGGKDDDLSGQCSNDSD